jgi:hypothetical protein
MESGSSGNITFNYYMATNSTQPSPITLNVMRGGNAKMSGSDSFSADPNSYKLTVTTNNSKINAEALYYLTFNFSDGIDASGYFLLTIPNELIILDPKLSITINSSNLGGINPTPDVTQINSSKVYNISNLSGGLKLILPQILTLTISPLIQPGSAINVSQFMISIYYSSAGFLTANGLSNTLQMIHGVITNSSVVSDKNVTYSDATVVFKFNIEDKVPSGGYIYL